MPRGIPNLAPQEQDVHALLRLFLHKVDAGKPLTYATFREAWQEMHFSMIYEVNICRDMCLNTSTALPWKPLLPACGKVKKLHHWQIYTTAAIILTVECVDHVDRAGQSTRHSLPTCSPCSLRLVTISGRHCQKRSYRMSQQLQSSSLKLQRCRLWRQLPGRRHSQMAHMHAHHCRVRSIKCGHLHLQAMNLPSN